MLVSAYCPLCLWLQVHRKRGKVEEEMKETNRHVREHPEIVNSVSH